jgi:hypothetical protein
MLKFPEPRLGLFAQQLFHGLLKPLHFKREATGH